METRVQKWGNSLALRIPKPFAAEMGLEHNSTVEVSLVDGKLIIAPVVEPALNEQNARDIQIINQRADYLNQEAADVLAYQVAL